MNIFAFLIVGQVTGLQINQKILPEFILKTLSRIGIEESPETIAGGYKANQFYYAKRIGIRAVQLSYYANTDTFHLSDEESGRKSYSGSSLPLKQLQSAGEREFASSIVRGFMPASSIKTLKMVSRNEPENPLITFGWQAVVNGYPAGYEGDNVRITLSRSMGRLVSLEMRRNVVYQGPKIVLSMAKATEVARQVMGNESSNPNDVRGELRYHLFPDKDSRTYWETTKKIRLRVGYFYSDSGHRSCFVDAETGLLDIISR